MTINEAFALAKKKDSNLVPIGCIETKNWFKVSMANKSGEAIGNGCTYAINKITRECEWKSMFADRKFNDDPILRLYDADDVRKVLRTMK